jgi:hypothetical protein
VLFPVTDHPADVLSILDPALDSLYIDSSETLLADPGKPGDQRALRSS